MVSLLKSPGAFLERAKENGLSEEAVRSLANQQITTLQGLAYCLTLPGTSPTEEQLRNLLNPSEPTAVSRGALSAARMLMFEAQTMSLASLKQTIEHNEDRKVELAPAEREDRIARQKRKLQGLELTGPYENAHSNYNVVAAMLESDVPIYLEPHKFLTRNAEVARERPGKEVILDEHARLTIRDKAYKDKVAIQTELQLQEALTRRALACDLMGACTYSVMEAWHRFLLSRLSLPPPPNFRRIGMDQLLRCDRAAWVRLAEVVHSLKRDAAGDLPLDKAFPALQMDPQIIYHLAPLPGAAFNPASRGKGGGKDKKRLAQDSDTHDRKKGKGKGIPAPLQEAGLKHECSKTGLRICWNYNLKDRGCKFAKAGDQCKRGLHLCMRCEQTHPLFECKAKAGG